MRALNPLPTQLHELAANEAVPHLTKRAGRSPLGGLESLVLSKINGRRTIEDLAALVGVTPTELATLLTHLIELEMVHLDAPSTDPSASGSMQAASSAVSGTMPASRREPEDE